MIDAVKINDIVSRIASNFDPEKIILFGSYASGNPGNDSDIDLLIVKESDLPSHRRGFEIRKSLIGLKIPMDILVYTNSEFEMGKSEKYSFLSNILKKAKVLYERKS
jgi:uncharacterized protein